jgi:flagellin
MGLRINNNIAAQNAYRNLSVTDGQMGKSLEKLSSGFRINRAADDAAGLSISEGLRSQIGGLKVAVRNAQDGISVVQTAEGALTETHSILQRMRDLSVQASSTGSQDTDARTAAQTEFTQLNAELDRIATTTAFGGQKLLDPSGAYTGTFQVGANTASADQIAVDLGTAAFGGVTAVTGFDSTGLGVVSLDLVTGRRRPSPRSTMRSRVFRPLGPRSVHTRTGSSTPSTTSMSPWRTCPPRSRASGTRTWPPRWCRSPAHRS